MADDTTFDDVIEFFTSRVDEQKMMDDGTEVPDHAEAMVVSDAAELLRTAERADMRSAMEDDETPSEDDEVDSALAEAAVNVITSVFTFAYERDLELADQMREQMDFIEQLEEFTDAMEDAESDAEQRKVMDELLTDEMMEVMGVQQSPTIGSNVDSDDYEHDGIGRGVQ